MTVLTLLMMAGAAVAAPVTGRVTAAGVAVVDARVTSIGPGGVPAVGGVFTDASGDFTLDVPEGSRVVATRAVRLPDGDRVILWSEPIATDEAGRVALSRVHDGSGVLALRGPRLKQVKGVMKASRRASARVDAACSAVLGAEDPAAARVAAEALREDLSVAGGTAFEGCFARHFGLADGREEAEQITHNLDAVAGVVEQRLWNGLASLGFAQWAAANAVPGRARAAAGVATQRFAGVVDASAGGPESGAARALLAQAYEVEGRAALQLGDAGGAVAKFHQAKRVYEQLGDVRGMGRANLGIAESEARRGRGAQALEFLAVAQGLPLSRLDGVTVLRVVSEVGGDDAIAASERAADAYDALNMPGAALTQRIRHAELVGLAGDLDAADTALAAIVDGLADEDPYRGSVARVRDALWPPAAPETPSTHDDDAPADPPAPDNDAD